MKTLDVSIWRGDGRGGYRSYAVPCREEETVLDLVTRVQRTLDATLSYRFACRVGVCGSCAMTVNGKPRWTCRTLVRTVATDGTLRIGPLDNMRVIKDLACDMTVFFEKWQAARGRFVPADPPPLALPAIEPDSRRRLTIDEALECITCGVCYAACDVVAAVPDYLGPAALNRAWTLINDERDGGGRERLKAVAGRSGCVNCHTDRRCQALCPNGLNPAASIAGLKRTLVAAWLKGRL